jgi:uncharacterized protein YqeY
MQMNNDTKNAMRQIKRRLDKTIRLFETACGYEENVRTASNSLDGLTRLIESELIKRDEKIPKT